MNHKTKRNLVAYSFLLPNFIGFFLFIFIPVILTLSLSFTEWRFIEGFDAIKFSGFTNFIRMWQDEWFISSLKNSFIYSFVSVVLTTGLGLILAVLVERYLLKGKSIVRLMFFTPYVTSVVVAAFVWQMMLSKQGIIQAAFGIFGIYDLPQWLGDPGWALWVIIMIGVWRTLGYAFVIYLAGLQGIPKELYESAEMDGAKERTILFNITIPLLRSTTFFVVITRLIFSFRLFAEVQILTRGGPGTSTSVLAYYIYLSAFRYYKMGYAASVTIIMFIIIFIFTLFQWRGQKKIDY